MGGRLLKRWVRYPLVDAAMIHSRLDAVQEDKNQGRRDVRELLENVYDLERLSSKITMGHANARRCHRPETSAGVPSTDLDVAFAVLTLSFLNLKAAWTTFTSWQTSWNVPSARMHLPTINEGGIMTRFQRKTG